MTPLTTQVATTLEKFTLNSRPITMRKMGWKGWKFGAEIMHSHLEKSGIGKDIRILDVCAGTGLVGKVLSEFGYTNITALDFSNDMLDQCKARDCYKEFIQADLNEESLENYKNSFDVIIGIGAFSKWVVKEAAMGKLVDCTKKGGLLCFSFNRGFLEPLGFQSRIDQLIESGRWRQIGFEERISGLQKEPMHYPIFQVI